MAEVAGTPKTVPEVCGAVGGRSDNVFVMVDSEAAEVEGSLPVVLSLVLRFALGLGLEATTSDSSLLGRAPFMRLTITIIVVRPRGRRYPSIM